MEMHGNELVYTKMPQLSLYVLNLKVTSMCMISITFITRPDNCTVMTNYYTAYVKKCLFSEQTRNSTPQHHLASTTQR